MDMVIDYSGNVIDKFSLEEKIGNGSFGAVYKAHNIILDSEVAVKFLKVTDPKKAFEMFKEAAIPYKCQHKNIVNIKSGQLSTFEGQVFFIIEMDLIDGGSVEKLLKTRFLTLETTLNIIVDVLFALEHSHLQEMIHRDLKPANILFDSGVAKISDFGLAATLNSQIEPWVWYFTHAAPETFTEESVATVQTDIFAVGMTMYRMVNNVPDWEILLDSIPNAKDKIQKGKLIYSLPTKPYVPSKIVRIINKACATDPLKRYQRASEMRNAIEKIIPKYTWRPKDEYVWVGQNNRNKYDVEIIKKKTAFKVIVKYNNRKSSKDCNSFSDLDSAKRYFYKFISSTSIE